MNLRFATTKITIILRITTIEGAEIIITTSATLIGIIAIAIAIVTSIKS